MNSPPAVLVRRMDPGDLKRVMEIAWSLKVAPRWAPAAYLAVLDPEAEPHRIALVAEETGGVVGFLVAALLPPQAELETIAVAEDGQRRGLGSRLLGAMVEELKTRQVTEVMLEVRTSNRAALGLYRGRGFVEVGRRTRYYADPEEDAVLLELRLAEP